MLSQSVVCGREKLSRLARFTAFWDVSEAKLAIFHLNCSGVTMSCKVSCPCRILWWNLWQYFLSKMHFWFLMVFLNFWSNSRRSNQRKSGRKYHSENLVEIVSYLSYYLLTPQSEAFQRVPWGFWSLRRHFKRFQEHFKFITSNSKAFLWDCKDISEAFRSISSLWDTLKCPWNSLKSPWDLQIPHWTQMLLRLPKMLLGPPKSRLNPMKRTRDFLKPPESPWDPLNPLKFY